MATYAECLSIVREVLGEYLEPGQTAGENDALVADLGLSSLQMLELVVEIEDQLDISLPLNQLPDVRTVHEFAQMLESVAGGAQP
ncbi:MAG: acyl carrier protein [Gammaproteobacteria bacterium]|jgi:acyl carrier protein|nr:MAG: acyl carrier protein [Gammaproteobacteria bacterium]